MPRLWIISDLHLESVPYPYGFKPKCSDFDILVVAGDVWQGNYVEGLAFVKNLAKGKPVVFVMGNHEHWNGEFHKNLHCAEILAQERGINLLNNNCKVIHECCFIGGTLWSDYRFSAEKVENDFITGEKIEIKNRCFTIGDSIALHTEARNKLEFHINNTDLNLPIVMVTHHAPHFDCLPKNFYNTWIAGNVASDLSNLTDTGRIVLWIHGHLHDSVDITRPNGTRILCNPAGKIFSNLSFNENLVVEIP
ncbi:metallophosphoesterase [Candidatus Uabimicrobium sp. HlEnr_7]|uniref:metallophosphoesterase n=1 Tax=Candidatus Uabimicrobium helgolandensis TaxID=3095367 RepID=UPI003557509F